MEAIMIFSANALTSASSVLWEDSMQNRHQLSQPAAAAKEAELT